MNSYVLAGYVITFAALGLYTVRVLRRERALRRATSPHSAKAE